jgi:Flp pilus assembly protein TadG
VKFALVARNLGTRMSKRCRKHTTSRAKGWFGLRTVRRLACQEDGTAAVEFGLIAMPFLALVFAIIETALVFFANQVLETATAESARLIMTGQAQTQGLTPETFKDQVCAHVYGLFDCAGGVYVDVQTFKSFDAVDLNNPIDKDGKLDTSGFAYSPGGPGDIVVVRLIYQWPIYLSMLGLSNMANNSRLMMATAAFRNEPF